MYKCFVFLIFPDDSFDSQIMNVEIRVLTIVPDVVEECPHGGHADAGGHQDAAFGVRLLRWSIK